MEAWIKTNPWWILAPLLLAMVVCCVVCSVACVPPEKEKSVQLPVKLEPLVPHQHTVRLPDGHRWGYGSVPPEAEEIWYLGRGWLTFELEGQRFLCKVNTGFASFPKE
jgi:hypothetical protein